MNSVVSLRLKSCTSGLVLGMALLAVSEQALAQAVAGEPAPATTAMPEAAAGLDAIVVTARRRTENLQNVPIAITAIPQETLNNLRVAEAEDLEVLEPSLSVSPASGYPNKPVYSLRGIRPTEAIYGQDPTVAIYFADVVQSPAAGSNLGFYDLESVQVLKGPQGTLFGRNTVGGAILLTPTRPGDVFSGYVEAAVGSYGLLEIEAAADIPVSDTLRIRVAGQAIESEGYQTNVAPGPLFGSKLGGEKTRSARLTAVWEPTAEIENTTIFVYDDKETNGRGTVFQAANPDHPLISATPGLQDAVQRAANRDVDDIEGDIRAYDNVSAWSVINTTTADLSDDLTVKSILAYREVDTALSGDLDATALNLLNLPNQRSDLQHYSGELQLQGDSLGGRLDWVAGAYYYHEEGTEYSPGTFYPQVTGIGLLQQGASVDNDSYSVFAQASYDLTEKLTLTAGARMNWDTRRLTLLSKTDGNCTLQVADPNDPDGLVRLPADQCSLPLEKSFSQPTGTLSVDYQVTPGILVYATSRLGYRSGGFNLRADRPDLYEPFDPETAIDAEIGAKADWSIGTVDLRTNVAVYNQWYDDIQRTVAALGNSGSPISAVQNAASAEVFGIEVQQTIQPTDGLTVLLSYTYIDPKYNEWTEIDPATQQVVDISDTPFFFTPTHSGNATLIYEHPLPSDRGTLHFTTNAAYTGKHWINALHTSRVIDQHPAEILPLLQQEAYWLVNASAGWRGIYGTNIDVMAFVRNLTNERYKTGGVQLYTGASGFITAAYGEPRTYGLQVRYSF
jgi:iron complex outermembrane receptor protein